MYLWRLSEADFAERLDGGYGLLHDGRWNSRGRPVTYCATGPALCLLEKLVHIHDASRLPEESMLVQYHAPDDIALEVLPFDELPTRWRHDENATRSIGDAWLQGRPGPLQGPLVKGLLLAVPSVVVPVAGSDDRNVLVNHRHPDAGRISIAGIERLEFDPRLFAFG